MDSSQILTSRLTSVLLTPMPAKFMVENRRHFVLYIGLYLELCFLVRNVEIVIKQAKSSKYETLSTNLKRLIVDKVIFLFTSSK